VAVRFDVRVATLPSGVDPSSARVACDVLDNGDGTYTVAYIADVAASYDATVTLDGMTIGASAMHCLVLPGATVPSAATLELGLTSTRATIAGAPATFTITSRDAHGNPRGMGGDAWRVELRRVGVPADIVPARVRDNGDGTYSVVAMPKRKGTYTVVVSGSDGREVRSPAVELKVAAAPVAGSSSRALGNILDGLTDLVAGEPSLLFVEPCDALGNAHDEVAEVLGALRVELTDGSGRPDHESRAFARTQGQHIAVEVVAAVAGAALLHVAISGVPVRGSPFGVRVRPGVPDASKCTISQATWRVMAGEPQLWILNACDRFGNRCQEGGDLVELLGRHADDASNSQLVLARTFDRDNGSYALDWTAEQAGVWELRATVDGIAIPAAAPARVLVEPGLAYAHSTGVEEGTRLSGSALLANEWVAFLLLAKDRFGNPTMRGGDKLAGICSSSAEPVLMHDWNDGRYEIRFCPRALGSHSIRVSLNGGGDVIGSPFNFLVQPGAASAKHSSAHGPALDGGVLHDGVGNFLIIARDALGYRLERGGEPFAVKVVPRTHLHYGHVHAFKDNGDGSYDVQFTTAVSGKYQVEVTLDYEHIRGSPFPVTTNSAAGAHTPRSPRSPRSTHRPGSPPWPRSPRPHGDRAVTPSSACTTPQSRRARTVGYSPRKSDLHGPPPPFTYDVPSP